MGNSYETEVCRKFIDDGFVVEDGKSLKEIDEVKEIIIMHACQILGMPRPSDFSLDNLHLFIDKKNLNDFRVELIARINDGPKLRELYYSIFDHCLDVVVGNELVIQRRINLSIQLPDDNSSLLPIHADSWSGDSPFEVVGWLPLVDCFATKSMYILPLPNEDVAEAVFASRDAMSSQEIFEKYKSKLVFLDVSYGQF